MSQLAVVPVAVVMGGLVQALAALGVSYVNEGDQRRALATLQVAVNLSSRRHRPSLLSNCLCWSVDRLGCSIIPSITA